MPVYYDYITDSSPSGSTFTNIRIKASNDPTFGNSNGTTIQGIMYIEAPNTVTFKNDVAIQGVIRRRRPAERLL